MELLLLEDEEDELLESEVELLESELDVEELDEELEELLEESEVEEEELSEVEEDELEEELEDDELEEVLELGLVGSSPSLQPAARPRQARASTRAGVQERRREWRDMVGGVGVSESATRSTGGVNDAA